MPYSYPGDVPEQIKVLPENAQKIWVSVFNSVVDDEGSEEDAIKSAWAQVKSQYKKNEDGNWVKKELKNEEKDMLQKKEFVNTTKDKGFFKSFIHLKTENGKVKVFQKEVGGKKINYLRGSASNTQVDKEDDQMSKEFISKMKQNVLGMTVFAEHKHEIEKTIGYIDNVEGDEDNMIVDVALEDENDNTLVDKILKKIDHGIKIGYSIGGRVTKAVKEFNKDIGREVRKILDGEIYEVSVTPMPAGNGTWVAPITKSMNKWLEFVEDESKDNVEKSLNSDEEENTPKEKSNKTEKSDKSSSEQDETTPDSELAKVLDEILQQEDVQEEIYDLMWAFRMAISDVIYNDELEPASKKDKIILISDEFAAKIEALASQLSSLIETVDETVS